MKTIKFNDLQLSPVCLGAMNFGTTTSESDAFKVLDAFIDAGGNFIDTSNNYAHWAGTGDESETCLGKWLASRKIRDKVVIATKVGFDRHGEGAGLKASQIEYWCNESLRKLGIDTIDLYYAHTDDADTPQEETMTAFDKLVKAGKVRYLGASNYDTWRIADANTLAKERGLTPFTVNQQRFTFLAERTEKPPKYIFNEYTNRERLRFLKNRNMPLVAYSSLAKGGYSDPNRLPDCYLFDNRWHVLQEMAKAKGVDPSALVVAWMTNLYRLPAFPQVIPLFASSSAEHFLSNLRGVDLPLTDEEMATLTNG